MDGVLIGYWIYWPLVYTARNYTLQITDTRRLVSSVYYSLHQLFPGNGFYRGRFFSFLHSDPLVTAACAELLSTDSSSNWVPGWGPFHTNVLVFSSQSDFQLNSPTHQPATSRHWTADNFLNSLLLTTFRHEPHRKHAFHSYSPTVPRPLHRNRYLFFRLLHSNGFTSHNNNHHHDMLVWRKNSIQSLERKWLRKRFESRRGKMNGKY
jgi:hypothetical protein